MFGCFSGIIFACFGSFRGCLGAGGGGIGARSVNMGRLVNFRLDLLCGSAGLRGKDRLQVKIKSTKKSENRLEGFQ